TFALTFLASAAFDVEAESAGFVVALDRERSLGEEIANRIIKTDVRCGIRAAVAAYRGLIDADDAMNIVHAINLVVFAGKCPRVDKLLPQCLVEDFVHESALPRTGRSGNRNE